MSDPPAKAIAPSPIGADDESRIATSADSSGVTDGPPPPTHQIRRPAWSQSGSLVGSTKFLFTTPGVAEPTRAAFPHSPLTGEFLLKAIPLLSLSSWTLAKAKRLVKRQTTAVAEWSRTARSAGGYLCERHHFGPHQIWPLVDCEELLKEVWGPAYAKETHYLRVYLAQLRHKLEDDPSHPVHLLSEAGMGYRFQQ